MEIKTKFSIGDKIFYMFENRAMESTVARIEIQIDENDSKDTPFIVSEVYQTSRLSKVNLNRAYHTKKELLDDL